MWSRVTQTGPQLVDRRQQYPPASSQIELGVDVSEGLQIPIDGLDRSADVGRDPLGLLVVGEHTRKQESYDEDRAADTAGQQAVEFKEFEAEVVHGHLDATERQHDNRYREEQPKFLSEAEVRPPEMQVRNYR